MTLIPLSSNKYTDDEFFCVDDEDFDRISNFLWYVDKPNKNSNYFRIARNATVTERRDGYTKTIKVHSYVLNIKRHDKKLVIDHKDGNPFNNCKNNLQLVTKKQNSTKQGKPRNNTSGFKGVTFDKDTLLWRSQLGSKINGTIVMKYLGSYNSKEEAAEAYDKYAIEIFGEFAATNKTLGLL